MTEKILIAYAHPDDESLGFAGTMAHYADKAKVVVAQLTSADKGRVDYGDGPLREPRDGEEKKALIERRIKESSTSLALLGATPVAVWQNVPTREMIPSRVYIDRMKALLLEQQPTVVLGFNEAGTTLHQDHIASAFIIYRALTELLQAQLLPGFLRYLTSTLPQASMMLDKYGEIIVPDEELTTIDVSKQITRKIEAVYSHQSQKHIIEALHRNGVLDVPNERFLERITRSSSTARGGGDLFIGLDKPAGRYTVHPMPLHESRYVTSNSELLLQHLRNMSNAV